MVRLSAPDCSTNHELASKLVVLSHVRIETYRPARPVKLHRELWPITAARLQSNNAQDGREDRKCCDGYGRSGLGARFWMTPMTLLGGAFLYEKSTLARTIESKPSDIYSRRIHPDARRYPEVRQDARRATSHSVQPVRVNAVYGGVVGSAISLDVRGAQIANVAGVDEGTRRSSAAGISHPVKQDLVQCRRLVTVMLRKASGPCTHHESVSARSTPLNLF